MSRSKHSFSEVDFDLFQPYSSINCEGVEIKRLGLFISKQITDQLNGTIGFKKADNGLTNIFYFTVPC
jgi:signal transduction histidine kinase